MLARPQVVAPETLMKELEVAVPLVKVKAPLARSKSTFTPLTVLPDALANWLMRFSSSALKLSKV